MGAMASQITSLTIVYSIVYSDADQWKHQSSASLTLVWEIHLGPVNSSHKWPVTRKMFPFDDVIMFCRQFVGCQGTDLAFRNQRSCTPTRKGLIFAYPWICHILGRNIIRMKTPLQFFLCFSVVQRFSRESFSWLTVVIHLMQHNNLLRFVSHKLDVSLQENKLEYR